MFLENLLDFNSDSFSTMLFFKGDVSAASISFVMSFSKLFVSSGYTIDRSYIIYVQKLTHFIDFFQIYIYNLNNLHFLEVYWNNIFSSLILLIQVFLLVCTGWVINFVSSFEEPVVCLIDSIEYSTILHFSNFCPSLCYFLLATKFELKGVIFWWAHIVE